MIAGDTAIPVLQAMLAGPATLGLRDLRAAADAGARRRNGARAVAEDRARRPEGGHRRGAGPAPRGERAAAARTDAPRSGARPVGRRGDRQDRRDLARRPRSRRPSAPRQATRSGSLAASHARGRRRPAGREGDRGGRGLFGTLAADRSLPAPMRTAAFIGTISAAGPRAPDALVEDARRRRRRLPRGGHRADRRRHSARRHRAGVRPAAAPAGSGPGPGAGGALALPGRPRAAGGACRRRGAARPTCAWPPCGRWSPSETCRRCRSWPRRRRRPERVRCRTRHAGRWAGVSGRAVDDAIVAALKQPASDAIAVELLKAVAERRLFLAKPSVSASLSSPSAAVRIEGMKTLRAIGSPSDASVRCWTSS